MDVPAGFPEGRRIVEVMERRQTEPLRKALLGNGEALGEYSVHSSLVDVGSEAVDRGPEKQCGRSIQGQVEEEWLEVDHAVCGHAVDKIINMLAERQFEVLVFRAGELLAQ